MCGNRRQGQCGVRSCRRHARRGKVGRTSREPGSSLKTARCAIDPAKKEAPPAPVGRDTDGDGLSDRDEIANLTNIFLPDTDLDGVSDGDEVKNGTNPLLLISN